MTEFLYYFLAALNGAAGEELFTWLVASVAFGSVVLFILCLITFRSN